jgi:hypothetical protein
MKKLTAEERRRMFAAQQAARQAWDERLNAAPEAEKAPAGTRRRRAVGAVLLATLIGTGLLAAQVVEFHVPTSLEAFLPRS